MKKLYLLVCENFLPEVNKVVENGELEDVAVLSLSCLCNKKGKEEEKKAGELIRQVQKNDGRGLILCSCSCPVLRHVPQDGSFLVDTGKYCFSHLLDDHFIEYVLQKGGYIITLGWLNHWREHLRQQGFDRDTAVQFYGESCRELVFLDAGIDPGAENKMVELSEYLQRPYLILNLDLKFLRYYILGLVHQWRLEQKSLKYREDMNLIQSQCAEYAAVMDVIGRIAVYHSRRDTIGKIKELFITVFGARRFKYWECERETGELPDKLSQLISEPDSDYVLSDEENRLLIKIKHDEEVYGVVDVSDFLFPEYLNRYLNFAIEISRVCGLVLSNISQYEKLERSERKLQYLSTHDPLTGLYNRTFLNEFMEKEIVEQINVVFVLDIDNLKYANDNFGHAAGDRLILLTADILRESFRRSDVVARTGGDEFVVLATGCDSTKAETLLSRLRENVERYNRENRFEYADISLSVGYVAAREPQESLESMLQRADREMYKDKAARKFPQ